MAGYKQTVLDFKPICFLTFDGDTLYNSANGELVYKHITDESGNEHHGILQTNDDPKKSYMMGQPSMVERENDVGQASITFAPFGYDLDPRVNFPFEKSLVEVLHTDALLFPDDYTIMFHVNKYSNESILRGLIWDEANNTYNKRTSTNTSTLKRTFIRKGPQIDISYEDRYYSNDDCIMFQFPGYSYQLNLTSIIGNRGNAASFYNKDWHIVATHKVIWHSGNLAQNRYRVYVSGILVHEHLTDKLFKPFSAENVSPIEIAGNRDASDPNILNDRQTSPLNMDQIAFFDKCLTSAQVMDCFKKTTSYNTLISRSEPTLFVPFDDREAANNTALNIQYGKGVNWSSSYSNMYPFVRKETVINSDRIGIERGAEFFNANAKIHDSVYNSNVLSASGDFTMEFWGSFTDIERCIIVSCQSNVAPFKGILIEGNRFFNEDRPGMIQVRFDDTNFLTAPEFTANGGNSSYNDGVIRHYAIVRSGTTVMLYIDGVVVNSMQLALGSLIPNYGALYFMGMGPGDTNTNGVIGQFVFYNRALGRQEITARSFFNVKMIIKGRVTLQGTPYKSDIRIYQHGTGELLHEYQSDTNGMYAINVYTNNFVDIMFLDKQDTSIQMRVIGPIIAHEYVDY